MIDNDILPNNLEQLIRSGPLVNIDILSGVTADESLYFAKEYLFHHYLPKKYRTVAADESKQPLEFSYSKKNDYMKSYLKKYYPRYLCFYKAIQARYTPLKVHQNNITEVTRLFTNLIRLFAFKYNFSCLLVSSSSDLVFYYDFVRFLHKRLRSGSSASTYVYYYTNPPIFDFEYGPRSFPHMIGRFVELDLIWGIPFFNQTSRLNINMHYNVNLSYTSKEINLSYQMIRYWTNFAKTGTKCRIVNESLCFYSQRKSK